MKITFPANLLGKISTTNKRKMRRARLEEHKAAGTYVRRDPHRAKALKEFAKDLRPGIAEDVAAKDKRKRRKMSRGKLEYGEGPVRK